MTPAAVFTRLRAEAPAPLVSWLAREQRHARVVAVLARALGNSGIEKPAPPNPYQLAVLRVIVDGGGRVVPEAGGYWRTPDRRLFPPLPSSRDGKVYDWVSSNTVYSLAKKGLLERTHEGSAYYRDPHVVTPAGLAALRPPPVPPDKSPRWRLVDDGDWAIWRTQVGSRTFWSLARRTDGQVWTDPTTLSRSYTRLADAQEARQHVDERLL